MKHTLSLIAATLWLGFGLSLAAYGQYPAALNAYAVALTPDQYSQLSASLVSQGEGTVTDANDMQLSSQGLTGTLSYDSTAGYAYLAITAKPTALASMSSDDLGAYFQQGFDTALSADVQVIWYPTADEVTAFLAQVTALGAQ